MNWLEISGDLDKVICIKFHYEMNSLERTKLADFQPDWTAFRTSMSQLEPVESILLHISGSLNAHLDLNDR